MTSGMLKFFLGCAAILFVQTLAYGQDRVDRAVQVLVTLCVAGGQVTKSQADSSPAGGTLRFESNKGNFITESYQAVGLIEGINSKLTALQADQADKARECMMPHI